MAQRIDASRPHGARDAAKAILKFWTVEQTPYSAVESGLGVGLDG